MQELYSILATQDDEKYYSWVAKDREHWYLTFQKLLEEFCRGRKEWGKDYLEWKAELRDLINENKHEMSTARDKVARIRNLSDDHHGIKEYIESIRKKKIKEENEHKSMHWHINEGS